MFHVYGLLKRSPKEQTVAHDWSSWCMGAIDGLGNLDKSCFPLPCNAMFCACSSFGQHTMLGINVLHSSRYVGGNVKQVHPIGYHYQLLLRESYSLRHLRQCLLQPVHQTDLSFRWKHVAHLQDVPGKRASVVVVVSNK